MAIRRPKLHPRSWVFIPLLATPSPTLGNPQPRETGSLMRKERRTKSIVTMDDQDSLDFPTGSSFFQLSEHLDKHQQFYQKLDHKIEQHLEEKLGVPRLGPLKAMRTCGKALMACFCVAFVYKCITTYFRPENLNPRQIPFIRSGLRSTGYDSFDETKILVQICDARDMKGKGERGLLVDSMFRGQVAFWYNRFTTDARADGQYDQTKMLVCPQGASKTRLAILVNSLVGADSEVGSLTLNTQMDILDRDRSFWGRKQTYRLKNEAGDFAGTLSLKFRKLTPSQEENYYLPICDGIDNESGLGAEVMKVAVKLSLPDNLRKIKGELKCRILSMILQGKVKEVAQNVEQDSYFVKIQHCSLGMLDFDVRKAELIEAKKRGLNEPPKRFYFCVYDRKKDAETMMHPPVVFTSVTSVKRVDVSTRRNDEFTVRWEIPGAKDKKKHEDSMTLRAKDKDRDLWINGMDQLMSELANLQLDLNNAAELARKKAHFLKISQASIEAYGCPSTAEDWKGWYDMMESQGASPEVIKEVYKDLAVWIDRQGLWQEWKDALLAKEAEGTLDLKDQDAKFRDPEKYWKEDLDREQKEKSDWGDYVSGVFSSVAGGVSNYGTLTDPNAVDITQGGAELGGKGGSGRGGGGGKGTGGKKGDLVDGQLLDDRGALVMKDESPPPKKKPKAKSRSKARSGSGGDSPKSSEKKSPKAKSKFPKSKSTPTSTRGEGTPKQKSPKGKAKSKGKAKARK